MNSVELRAKREAAEKQFDALMNKRTEERSADEHKKFMDGFKSLKEDIERLNDEIEVALVAEKTAAKQADKAFSTSTRKTEEQKALSSFSLSRSFAISAGTAKFDGAEKEVHDETIRNAPTDFSAEGVAIAPKYMRIAPKQGMDDNEKRTFFREQHRDLNVTTAGDGGYTVATDLGAFIPVLMPTPIIRNLGATIMGGQTANLDFPTGATRATAVWEGEVDAAAETSPTFGTIQLRPKRLAAYAVESKQLLIQSNIAIENYLRNLMSAAVSDALDNAAFNGTGTPPVPEGIENITGVGSVTSAGIANFDEAMAYEFKDDLSAAYALKGNLAWVMGNATDSTLRQVDLATDIGIRLLGGVAGQQNNNMINYQSFASDLINADSIIFGNWEELMLAQWGALDILVNPYSLDTTGQVRLTINSYWDLNVKHPASFSIAADLV